MKAFQVPTRTVEVDVYLARGTSLRGRLFLAASPNIEGDMASLSQALNDERDFLPFEVGEESGCRAIVLNKEHIIRVHLAAGELPAGTGADADTRQAEPAPETVLNLSDGTHVCGQVQVDSPETASRLVDKLNRAPRFIPVVCDQGVDLVQREHVLTLD